MFYTIITEIWDALQAAAEADLSLAQVIVESAGVIVTSSDMTTCYDERGIYIYSITIVNLSLLNNLQQIKNPFN